MNTPRAKGQKRTRKHSERKPEDYTRYSPPKMKVSGTPNRLLSALFDTKNIFKEGGVDACGLPPPLSLKYAARGSAPAMSTPPTIAICGVPSAIEANRTFTPSRPNRPFRRLTSVVFKWFAFPPGTPWMYCLTKSVAMIYFWEEIAARDDARGRFDRNWSNSTCQTSFSADI